MRTIPAAAALLAFLAGAAGWPAPQKSPPKKTSKTRKPPAKRKPAPKAPPVSAATRAQATSEVNRTLETPAGEAVENAAALVPFFEQLYRLQQGEGEEGLHILHYGDSHTAADEWTGWLRAQFQARFGDGGGGYTLAGKPFNSYRRLDMRSGASKGWYSDGLVGRAGDGLYGLGGVSITTTRRGESIWLAADCRVVELFYLQQPGGGALQFYDNGAAVERIATEGELGPGYLRYETQPGWHRFEIETLDRAPVRLFGWVTANGRGVTYETLGINGAQASIVFNWHEELLAEHLGRRNPALIVLAYGTNEAGNKDWTPESYRDMFYALIQRFRKAAPAASILVVGPPDRLARSRGKWQPHPGVDKIVEAQCEAALAAGCAYWDLRAKMGGKGSMRRWVLAGLAQYDHVHFTAAGYRMIGNAVFQDLMGQYDTFRTVREQLVGRDKHGQTGENP